MKRQLIKALAAALFFAMAALLLVPAQDSSALAPLSYTWDCDAYGSCGFSVTTNNHASYRWNFGDGTSATVKQSATSHVYNVSVGWHTFHVDLVGYKPSGHVDNIISCDVTFYKSGPGGDPSRYKGTC